MSRQASRFADRGRCVPCVLPHFKVEGDLVYDSTRALPPRRLTPLERRILQQCDGVRAADDLRDVSADAPTVLENLRELGLLVFAPAAKDVGADDPRWLVLSPHPDDAALSIGGTLTRAQRAQVWIATLATRTSSSVHPALDGSVAEVSALRCAEDVLCARYLGAHWLGLGLDDAVLEYRGARTPDAAARARRFEAAIESAIAEVRPAVVLCPLGVGGHHDHEATHAAVLRLYGRGSRVQPAPEVRFYEDLPYAAVDYFDVLQRIRRFERAGTPLVATWTDLDDALDDKLTAISIYRSQACREFAEAAARYASACGREMQRPHQRCERLWRYEP